MNDMEKREHLIKSYEGQIRYCQKRIEKDKRDIVKNRRVKRNPYKDIKHFEEMIEKWQARIDACKNGELLDFLGTKL